MIRHLFLIIDLSQAMLVQDLRPNRLSCTLRAAKDFVRDYFDQNPISQLGIIITSDRRAERLTELSGNPRCHLAALENLHNYTCVGEPTLQNALLLAESRLKYVPHHNEVIVIMANMTTCDPGDIHQTIATLSANRIRCSVISLAVEVFVYRALAQLTHGTFHVVLDYLHLKTLLSGFVPPPVASVESDATLIRMGFPHSNTVDVDAFSVKRCMCHLKSQNTQADSNAQTPSRPQYACPRCRAVCCELPMECTVCGLTLVAAPHLARAYHHLFPLDAFEITSVSQLAPEGERLYCSGCDVELHGSIPISCCSKCRSAFCNFCDAILHDSVHSCPVCVSKTLQ
ncbi:unnamed protein product [Dicrocoelium dendriticum]|nr:unnamed protein product [Dicrocoelium dendriticum]